MKHSIILVLFVFSLSIINAQSYSLSWLGESLDEEITVFGDAAEQELLFLANLTNNSDDTDTIKVKRVFVDFEEGAHHLLCWQNCYPANPDSVFVSPLYVVLGPGETCPDLTFSGHYRPNGISGTSTVEYTFFNINDEDENISVTVHYSTSLTSNEETFAREKSLVVYPNPAYNNVFLSSSADIQKIQLTNQAGQILLSKVVSGNNLELNTAEMAPGIYLLSVFSENEMITKKLIIK